MVSPQRFDDYEKEELNGLLQETVERVHKTIDSE